MELRSGSEELAKMKQKLTKRGQRRLKITNKKKGLHRGWSVRDWRYSIVALGCTSK